MDRRDSSRRSPPPLPAPPDLPQRRGRFLLIAAAIVIIVGCDFDRDARQVARAHRGEHPWLALDREAIAALELQRHRRDAAVLLAIVDESGAQGRFHGPAFSCGARSLAPIVRS